jgi:carboxylate-amine ligase
MYHLFERFGIELEYMIVNRNTFAVMPVTDKVIEKACGEICNEVTRGNVSWSNELALHVIEFKTSSPVSSLLNLNDYFMKAITEVNAILKPMGGALMGGPMHPFMDPQKEIRLWPHDYNPIYEAFNRIFSCKGHGWANLQSMHINLPFANDEEFARLHAAIRLVLPIIPAISAGSPVVEGKKTGFLDTRMEVYRTNSSKIPSITGDVIPEPVFSQSEYQDKILEKIYADLAPFDPECVLQEEWVNARGAIARFERNTIEIRVIDVQENPAMDIAIAAVVIGAVKLFANEVLCTLQSQKKWDNASLKKILLDTIKYGENAVINNREYLNIFGIDSDSCKVSMIWESIFKKLEKREIWTLPYISKFSSIAKDSLATRIIRSYDTNTEENRLSQICRTLCESLERDFFFR